MDIGSRVFTEKDEKVEPRMYRQLVDTDIIAFEGDHGLKVRMTKEFYEKYVKVCKIGPFHIVSIGTDTWEETTGEDLEELTWKNCPKMKMINKSRRGQIK